MAMRKEYCNPAIFTLYKEPLMIVGFYAIILLVSSYLSSMRMGAGAVVLAQAIVSIPPNPDPPRRR